MKRIKEIMKILDLKQIIDIIIFPVILIVSLLTKLFIKKNIWIIAENPNEACDNGYVFFEYLRTNRKDINTYYVINFKSKDYEKVKKIGNIIKYRSLKHWIYYLNASKIIVTQKYANPSPALFYILHTKKILKTPRIYLKHGITKDDTSLLYYNRTNYRIFICGAKREYEYVKERFGYPSGNVVYTGFARFDKLNTLNNKRNNLILITPTWRKWINNQNEFDQFMENYYELINNQEFIEFIENNNIYVKVVLHKNMKRFKITRQSASKNITINHNEEVDIQFLLNELELIITDYSSIFFDVAYRKKPIIYYQFDKKEYRKNHHHEGYFSYEKDGFGEVLDNSKSVIDKVKYYINNGFEIEPVYEQRMDDFFERRDKNNCKRILEVIEGI